MYRSACICRANGSYQPGFALSIGPQVPALQLPDWQSVSLEQGQPCGNGGVAQGLGVGVGVGVAACAAVGALIDKINGKTSAAGAYLSTSFRRDTGAGANTFSLSSIR
jgi:hypothetical protein